MNFIRDYIDKIIRWTEDLSDQQRRILLAVVLLAVSVVMGFVIYWVFFRGLIAPQGEQVNVNGELVDVAQLPDILANLNREGVNINESILPDIDVVARGGETFSQELYTDEAVDIVLSADGKNMQFYDPKTGQFYRINANGEVELINDKIFKGVQQVNWSNDTNKAVLQLEDGFNVMYDFERDKQYTLHEDMEEFDFSPNDNQLSYKFLPGNTDEHWLGISNIDGSGVLGIEPLGDNENLVKAKWSPSGQSIGTVEKFDGADTKKVTPIGFKGENYKAITVQGKGFDYNWSPDGKQMLYSTYSGTENYTDSLSIVDASGDAIGGNNIDLGINTSVEKCTFNSSGSSVYCAVPTETVVGSGIGPEKLYDVPHDIYKVDLNSGVSTKIATPADATSGALSKGIDQVMVTDEEDMLYYVESETGNIRRLLLK
ncbi:MAG: hypothetical protein Q8P90_00925 [bacterium]|nr:hypothetical protein [bacterium]